MHGSFFSIRYRILYYAYMYQHRCRKRNWSKPIILLTIHESIEWGFLCLWIYQKAFYLHGCLESRQPCLLRLSISFFSAPDICRFFLGSYFLHFILDALYIQERTHMEFSHLSLLCEIIILQNIVLCILEVVPMFSSVFVCCSCCCKGTLNISLVYFRKK